MSFNGKGFPQACSAIHLANIAFRVFQRPNANHRRSRRPQNCPRVGIESLETRELLSAVAISTQINGVDGVTDAEPYVAVGIDYNIMYQVTNTGTDPLSKVVVTDDGGNGFAATPFSLQRFIAAPNRVDTVHDAKRGMLYISTSDGYVLRYDMKKNGFLTPFHLGGQLMEIDISPDQNTLVVADKSVHGNQGWLDVVNLNTNTFRHIGFPVQTYTGGTVSAVFTSNTTVVISGASWGQLYSVDISTNASEAFGSGQYGPILSVSADLSTVAFVDGVGTGTRAGRYQVTDKSAANATLQSTSWDIGISRDGSQIAAPTYFGTFIYDSRYRVLGQIGTYATTLPIGVVYSPVADVAYFAWYDSQYQHASIDAWNTNTLTQIAVIDATPRFGWIGLGAFVNGRLKISRDGETLISTVTDGVMVYGTDDFHPTFTGGDTNSDGLLDPGEVWTYQAADTSKRGYFSHAATVKAVSAADGAVTGSDSSQYRGVVYNIDYGDAPDPKYPTLYASNGATHQISPNLMLGTTVGQDFEGRASEFANADNDDGVVFNKFLVPGQQTTVEVKVKAVAAAYLNAWIDFNGDGDWNDPGEHVATNVVVNNGTQAIPVSVPVLAKPGSTFARFRLSSTAGLGVTGPAADGEVEDYQLRIRPKTPVVTTTGSIDGTRPILNWPVVSTAVSYEVRIATRGAANSWSQTTLVAGATNYILPDRLAIGRYSVWVRAIDGDGYESAWSSLLDIRINVAPETTISAALTFDQTPTVTWNAILGASTYDVYIQHYNGNSASQYKLERGVTTTEFSPATDLPAGRYRFFVRAVTADGFVASWNQSPADITVGGQTDFISISDSGLWGTEFSWKPVEGAVRYDLWVNQIGGTSQIIRQQALTSGKFGAETGLPKGGYQAWVRAINADQRYSQWSVAASFEITKENGFIDPIDVTIDQTPVWNWDALPGALTYDISIQRIDGRSNPLFLLQRGISGTQFTPAANMPFGKYRISYRGVDADGNVGAWQYRTTDISIGAPTEFLSPSGNADGELKFSWTPMNGAVRYDLWVNEIGSTSQIIRQQDLTSATYAPDTALPKGRYQAWVRAINADQKPSQWSAATSLEITKEYGFIDPVDMTIDQTPVWNWEALPKAVTHDISIQRIDGRSNPLFLLQQGITGTQFTPTENMPFGKYRISYRGVDADGNVGAWQLSTTDISIGGAPEFLSPSNTTGTTPVFAWRPIDGAVHFDLWVDQIDGIKQIIRETDLTTSAFTATSALPAGTYRAWLRAINIDQTASVWSMPIDFTVV